jgi:23S rRNA U2552 (ribose-2'-O)-methylase RlmE/FtsJ
MVLYSLPKSEFVVHNVHCTFIRNHKDDLPFPETKWGFDETLNTYRNMIDKIDSNVWKKTRWYINVYDFLVKDPIINRAFFKYWEIIHEFDLFQDYSVEDCILHCAEAPGGFIQATNIFLQLDQGKRHKKKTVKKVVDEEGFIQIVKKNKADRKSYKIYTISLNKDLPQFKYYNLPSYNKNVLSPHLHITYGADNTGDINNWNNIRHIQRLKNDPFYFITADGGFDEGTDFNNKEQLHYNLILSELYSAILLQKKGGNFLLKMFDIFTETSVHFLYLLSQCYDEVHIYKPKTSRPTNSEKYIVCKSFILNDETRDALLDKLHHLNNKCKNMTNDQNVVYKLFKDIPDTFRKAICEMNSVFVKMQCAFLKEALALCNNESFHDHFDQSSDMCYAKRQETFAAWCSQYNLHSYI